jgi:transposase
MITQAGRENVLVVRRAQILLLAHKGWKRQDIREATGASIPTINRTKRWYREDGIEAAIYDAPRSGRPKKLDAQTRAIIIATACSAPPTGYSRWTYQLIADRARLGKKISGESVRLMMKADGIKPWREKNVVHPEVRHEIPGADV